VASFYQRDQLKMRNISNTHKPEILPQYDRNFGTITVAAGHVQNFNHIKVILHVLCASEIRLKYIKI